MNTSTHLKPGENYRFKYLLLGTVAAALIVRLANLLYASGSPLTFQPGPDEQLHAQLATDILAGSTQYGLHGFTDPLYPYLVATVFGVSGGSIFLLFLLQCLLDAVTCGGIALIGRRTGHQDAGLVGAALYAVSLPAVLYTATVLKATWVSAFLVFWTLLSLLTVKGGRRWQWIVLGIYTALGIGLRGNLAVLAVLTITVLPLLGSELRTSSGRKAAFKATALLLVGMSLPVALLSARNAEISGSWSPLPTNGGVVLHQVYNADNPQGLQFAPAFVSMAHPVHIWSGYDGEAMRRAGRDLAPGEVSAFWRNEAVQYITSSPWSVMMTVFSKLGLYFGNAEIPNNRSLADERMFSPVLKALPAMFGILAAVGVPGLLLVRERKHACIVALPLLTTAATFVLFFPEARFRFHGVALMSFLAGVTISRGRSLISKGQWKQLTPITAFLVSLLLLTAWQSQRVSVPATNWLRIGLAQLAIGDTPGALESLRHLQRNEGDSQSSAALSGMVALAEKDAETALRDLARASDMGSTDPNLHFNLALVLANAGRFTDSVRVAERTLKLEPTTRNHLFLADMLVQAGRGGEAIPHYEAVLQATDPPATADQRQRAGQALTRLRPTLAPESP
ncbi:MAG: glycosyltransferase family 39 protein [Lysobacteraceae bacterium]